MTCRGYAPGGFAAAAAQETKSVFCRGVYVAENIKRGPHKAAALWGEEQF